jgi:ATP-dependent Clp protease ATP-binding subunit ClpB
MDMNRLTQKSQEAMHDAQTKALRFGHTEVDVEHLLLALLDQPDGLVPRLLERAGADAAALRSSLEAELARESEFDPRKHR